MVKFPGRWLILILIGFLAIEAGGCSRVNSRSQPNNNDSSSELTTISAVPVEPRQITRTVEVVGTLWPDDQVTVSSQVEGQVEKIFVDVGDAVQPGQVMVSLNQEELRYQMDQRAANVRKTMAQLGLTDEQSELQDVAELPQVKKAAANLFDAEQRFRRSRELFGQSLVPRQDLDTAEARYRSAKADYDVVLQQVKTLQAQLRSEKAELDFARKKLRDTEIRAPFAGFVQERFVSPGQYLRVQTPVMGLVKPDPLKLRADVPEKMASWVQAGHRVEARLEAFPDHAFVGKVSRITPAVKEQSRAFSIEAIINNHDHRLKPGTFVRATVTTTKIDTVLLVPEAALNYLFGVYKVFLVDNGVLHEREVKLGDRVGDRIEATAGLRAGEQVALHPERLREGLAVRVQN
jgi:RND family efflux transporter MFP subunit